MENIGARDTRLQQRVREFGPAAAVVFLLGAEGQEAELLEELAQLEPPPWIVLPGPLASPGFFRSAGRLESHVFMSVPRLQTPETSEADVYHRELARRHRFLGPGPWYEPLEETAHGPAAAPAPVR